MLPRPQDNNNENTITHADQNEAWTEVITSAPAFYNVYNPNSFFYAQRSILPQFNQQPTQLSNAHPIEAAGTDLTQQDYIHTDNFIEEARVQNLTSECAIPTNLESWLNDYYASQVAQDSNTESKKRPAEDDVDETAHKKPRLADTPTSDQPRIAEYDSQCAMLLAMLEPKKPTQVKQGMVDFSLAESVKKVAGLKWLEHYKYKSYIYILCNNLDEETQTALDNVIHDVNRFRINTNKSHTQSFKPQLFNKQLYMLQNELIRDYFKEFGVSLKPKITNNPDLTKLFEEIRSKEYKENDEAKKLLEQYQQQRLIKQYIANQMQILSQNDMPIATTPKL